MKRLITVALLLATFAAGEAFAQPANATASVTLTVNNAIALTKNRDLAFGVIPEGTLTATVNPITGGAAAAMFTLGASANTAMNVSFASTDLTSGANTIGFAGAGTLSGNTVNGQAASTSVLNNSQVTTSGTGAYFFWAGGTATLSPTQATGAYSGSFTLSVSY